MCVIYNVIRCEAPLPLFSRAEHKVLSSPRFTAHGVLMPAFTRTGAFLPAWSSLDARAERSERLVPSLGTRIEYPGSVAGPIERASLGAARWALAQLRPVRRSAHIRRPTGCASAAYAGPASGA